MAGGNSSREGCSEKAKLKKTLETNSAAILTPEEQDIVQHEPTDDTETLITDTETSTETANTDTETSNTRTEKGEETDLTDTEKRLYDCFSKNR